LKQKWKGGDGKEVSSYWMTIRKNKDWNLKGASAVSQDREDNE
jgi:hypothetical protein